MEMMTRPIPERIAYIGQMMFNRHLTDIAGGNISARDGNTIYCTPRYAGSRWHWNLDPEDIVVGPIDTDELTESSSFSREGLSHLAVYRAFPQVNAAIHAHPPHILSFTAAPRPLKPVLRGVEKFGTLEYIVDAPPYSREQADSIVEKLRPNQELMESKAAAVLMPHHGIFIAGADLWQVLDTLERLEVNAKCALDQALIEQLS